MKHQALSGGSGMIYYSIKVDLPTISEEPQKLVSITVTLCPMIQQSIDAKDPPLQQTTKILFLRIK